MPEQFHFLQPLWLLALIPLAGILFFAGRHGAGSNPWRKVVDARLLPLLMRGNPAAGRNTALWILAAGWLLAVIALANPTWEQQPLPVFQTSTARVIVFDLSQSMLSGDVRPSRLGTARFKVEDILGRDDEGQTGLVVFAGDAFTVSPLTRDADTIRALLKALDPAIMPVQGSRADLGLLQARELLQQAGASTGQILLVADGAAGGDSEKVAAQLNKQGYPVSVLGVGTTTGAPLKDRQGEALRNSSGQVQLARLDEDALRAIASAGGGKYVRMSGSNADIKLLMTAGPGHTDSNLQNSDLQTHKWNEKGPWLAALLLPLAALAFRRGWLLAVLVLVGTATAPQPAVALGWQDLWQRNDQQAAQALQQEQYDQAATLATDPAQRGTAEYRRGDYQKAAEAFAGTQGADAAYNYGNALAQLGKYQEAISAYDQALAEKPAMEDAIANKAALEELLKQQQQQQDKQDSSGQQGEQEQPSQDSQGNESGQAADGSDQQQPSPQQQDGQGDSQFADANEQMDQEQEGDANEDQPGDTSRQEASEDQNGQQSDPGETPENTAEQSGADAGTESEQSAAQAEELTSEEQLAAQQWLRRIPDDPGGLLRRKFLYQYRQRAQQNHDSNSQDW